MAIKIDVPGIGEITVEGIAQEETMQQILEQVKTSEKTKRKKEADADKATKDLEKAAERASKSLDGMIDAEEEATKKSSKNIEDFSNTMKKGTVDLSKNLSSFAGSLAATATVVAASMVKNIDENAANPIKFGAETINTSIDLLAEALKLGVDAVNVFADAGLALGGPFLEGAQHAADKLAEFSKEAITAGAAIVKAGNSFMAAEFEKTVRSMKELTVAGASFSNGLTGLRNSANESKIGLTAFSNIVAKAAPNLQAIGVSATETTELMTTGMSALSKSVKGANGQFTTTRNQLLALGYSYEEQGEIMSLYLQQQAIAGKNLKNIAPAELAEGTREYAKNLKIISDFTGKDAKKIQERAQAEVLRGAVINKLNDQQRKSFEAFYAATEKMDPAAASKAQLDMLQRIASEGGSNVVAIQGNAAAAEAAQKNYQAILDGTGTLASAAGNYAEAAHKSSTSSLAQGTDIANLFKPGGPATEIAEQSNAMTKAYLNTSKDQVEKIGKTADQQMNTQDAVTTGFTKATEAVTEFQRQTETLATQLMPKYATVLSDSIANFTKMVTLSLEPLPDIIKMMQGSRDSLSKATPGHEVKEVTKKYDDQISAKEAELAKLQEKEKLNWLGKKTGLSDTPEITQKKKELSDLESKRRHMEYLGETLKEKQEQAIRDTQVKANTDAYGSKRFFHPDVPLTAEQRDKALKGAATEFAKQFADEKDAVNELLKSTITNLKSGKDTVKVKSIAGKEENYNVNRLISDEKERKKTEAFKGGENKAGTIAAGSVLQQKVPTLGAITAGDDDSGAHSPTGQHPKGLALDFRVKPVEGKSQDAVYEETIAAMEKVLQDDLKLSRDQYKIINEKNSAGGPHIHFHFKNEDVANKVRDYYISQQQEPANATPAEQKKELSAEANAKIKELSAERDKIQQTLDDKKQKVSEADKSSMQDQIMQIQKELREIRRSGGVKALAEGGSVAKGQFAIAGEKGPEIVKGPAEVTSKDLTQKMIVALDALREMKGQRFGANDFQAQVAMNEDRWRVLEERIAPMQKPGQNLDELRLELEAKMKERDNANPEYRKAMDYMMKDEGPSDHEKRTVQHLNDHTSILNQILNTLQHGNKLQSGILQNSY